MAVTFSRRGYIYKIIDDSELANVDELTKDEKENGIDTSKTSMCLPYDKGTKTVIAGILKPHLPLLGLRRTSSFEDKFRKEGEGMPVVRNPQFYFREDFVE